PARRRSREAVNRRRTVREAAFAHVSRLGAERHEVDDRAVRRENPDRITELGQLETPLKVRAVGAVLAWFSVRPDQQVSARRDGVAMRSAKLHLVRQARAKI